MFENFIKKVPKDCLICAIRPILYLNRINVVPAKSFCYHDENPQQPHLEVITGYKLINLAAIIILLLEIIKNIYFIVNSDPCNVQCFILLMESIYICSLIIFNLSCIYKIPIKLKEYHGLITLIQERYTRFGIKSLIPFPAAKRVYNYAFYTVIGFCVEEFLSICIVITSRDVVIDWQFVLRMIAIEVVIFQSASIGLYALQFLHVYEEMLQICFDEIAKCLNDRKRHGINIARTSKTDRNFVERIQQLHRLYLCLNRSLLVAVEYVNPEILVVYAMNVCIFLISLCSLFIIVITDGISLETYNFSLFIKASAIVLAFILCCNRGENLKNMGANTLSSLFKFETDNLLDYEFIQVEALIHTLGSQKPMISASNIFVLDNTLNASIAGTVLTYGIVVLQFYEINMH